MILFKKKIIWPWGQRSRSHEGHYGTWHNALWSCAHIPIIIDLSQKTKMVWPGQENIIKKTIIWPWGQRSGSHEGHYGTRHRLMVMHIRTICQWTVLLDLFEVFDLEVKGQGPTSNKTVHGQIVRICMTIRRCVTYRNDLRGTLTFDLKVKKN
jgi:hypothetical protein